MSVAVEGLVPESSSLAEPEEGEIMVVTGRGFLEPLEMANTVDSANFWKSASEELASSSESMSAVKEDGIMKVLRETSGNRRLEVVPLPGADVPIIKSVDEPREPATLRPSSTGDPRGMGLVEGRSFGETPNRSPEVVSCCPEPGDVPK